MISTCLVYTLYINIFNLFIWRNVKSWTFNILKYAKSLLKRLTWTKHSSTPGLTFLLWITRRVDQNPVVSTFFSLQAMWEIQHLSIYSYGDSLKMSHRRFWDTTPEALPCSHSSTAEFFEVPHSSKACHFRYRKVTTQWPGRYLTVLTNLKRQAKS